MVLKHRRLLVISLSLLLAVFAAEALPHAAKAIGFWLLLLLSLLLFVFSWKRRRLFTVVLALCLAACAFFSSYQVTYRKSLAEVVAAEESSPCSVTVLSTTGEQEDFYLAEGELHTTLNGKSVMLRVKIISPIAVRAGDVLFGDGSFAVAEDNSYMASNGFYGTVSYNDCKRVDTLTGVKYAIGNLRTALCERIKNSVPEENGALLCALLLGIRDGIPAELARDMARIGTTHMLSLSGMHLAVLTAGIAFLLKCLRLGRRVRTLALSLFVVFFMLLTGLSSSVLRAGFMFLLSAVPFFLREERDGLSSLTAAVAIICLFEPYAVGDLSLWLSALATLGILLLFDRKRSGDGRAVTVFARILRFFAFSLSVTFAATVTTLPLTLWTFGTLPLLSPLANLVLSPLVQLALYLALFVTALGAFPPLIWITTQLCKLIFTIARFFGDFPHTVLSFENSPLLPVVWIGSIALLSYFLFCPRKRFLFRVPVIICLSTALVIGGFSGVAHLSRRDMLTVTYYADTRRGTDAMLFRYKEERLLTVVSDFEAIGTAERSALAETAGEVDGFLLPYYAEGTKDYVEALLSSYKIYRLYIPSPDTHREREDYAAILESAAQHGVPTVAFSEDTAFFFGFLTVSRLYESGNANRPHGMVAELLFGYSRIGYYSASTLSNSHRFETQRQDLLIFGAYGIPIHQGFLREDFIKREAAILCPSPHFFPFSDASEISFALTGEVYLPMRTEKSR